ncbi:hypothetical protein [Anaeromicrobium sediminis]|uniref:Uncharacterized protein n=1 Tax=Anaeromicrobium sediminis TaxID=1478221 RepID=A0A267MNL9_9FIRM|nr:hypothetical protein [Anaeromicrobium sediminis]PAB61002.1 hypothetical protein CCE28_00800 [Anaeromicrobium sediminis]
MKVKCMLDEKKYNSKPKGDEIGKIVKRLEKSECNIGISDLAGLMVQGCTFRPAFLNGSKDENWISQQLFALDFDKGTTIEEEISRCRQLNIMPIFGYTTFSHSEKRHRFRLVFCSNKIFTIYEEAEKVQVALMNLFNKCDPKSKNISKLYFGGTNLIFEGYDNKLDIDGLLLHNKLLKKKIYKCNNGSRERKGVQDIKDINISNVSCTPKTHLHNMNIINAIKTHNTEYLKKYIGNKHQITFETKEQFFDFIRKIDLGELLELRYPNSFNCLFHNDKSPSASIFVNEDTGDYIYKCNSNSCGVSLNNIGVIEKLGRFKSKYKTYEFIKEIFNLKIVETEWQKKQWQVLMENVESIHNGELERNCPQAYKIIKRISRYLVEMHKIALDNIYNENWTDNEGNLLFYSSTGYIAGKLKISDNSLNKISQKIAVLAYLKLLNKVDDGQVNEDILKKSKHLNATKNKDKYKHVNYFSIPPYTDDLYKAVEQQAKKWKDNNYTMRGVSREMFYRGEGVDVANWLYPQFNKVTEKNEDGESEIVDRTTSKASDYKTADIVKTIFYLIDNKGYAREKEIVEILRRKYGKENISVQIKKSIKQIFEEYSLKKLRTNKIIKEHYGITDKGYPLIIVKNEFNIQNI